MKVLVVGVAPPVVVVLVPFCVADAAGYGILGTFGGIFGLTRFGSSDLLGITITLLISSESGLRGSGLPTKGLEPFSKDFNVSSVDFAGPCIFFLRAGGLGGFPKVGDGIAGNFLIILGSKETQSSSTR